MPGQPIPIRVLSELQRQFNHELGAAHAYTALAVWCVDQNLKGFGRYFYKQAGEEREHAQRFMDYLLDRGVMPQIAEIAAPKTKFKTLLDVARHARAMEQANTAGIHQAYQVALKAGDIPTQVHLHWFITEQVEEEKTVREIVAKFHMVKHDPASILDLDRELGGRGPDAGGDEAP
jgi:ferritin